MRAALLVIALVACSQAEPPEAPRSTPTAPTALGYVRADVAALDAARAHATVVDVRTREAFAVGHVPGAVGVPLASLNPREDPVAGWDPGLPVYVIDARGEHADKGARVLGSAGYEVFAVDGGMEAWVAAGLPVEVR